MSDSDDSPVSRLVDSEVRRAIANYGGNLKVVLLAIERDWIPKGDEPGVAGHLEALRDYLAATDVTEEDGFLLRYALTAPGTQRGIVPPLLVLEPNRNGFSERRKGEAAGQVTRLREVLDLGRAFLPKLSHETSQALVQLAAIATNRPEPRSSPALDQFRGLTTDEAGEVASIALESLKNPAASVRELAITLLRGLACFRFAPLAPEVCRSLRENAVLHPPYLYRDAGDVEAEGFLAILESGDKPLEIPHALQCLAWTRGRVALTSFRAWSEEPPSWAAHLSVPPEEFPPDAGWSLNASGERVELIDTRCCRLRPAEADSPGAIACRLPMPEACPCCGSPLSVLFDFTSIEAELPVHAPRRVICCLACSPFDPTFVSYHDDGTWEWISPTEPESADEGVEAPTGSRYVVREDAECPPFAMANTFEIDDATSIGGVPMWQQDAEYPRCPTCDERMRFLAQHDNAILREEGIYYAFFCPECRVLGVTYQQT